MKSHSLKPFDDGKYLSEEEAMKLLESIPIPKDESEKTTPPKVESHTPIIYNPDLESRIIDLNLADKGHTKSPDNWIIHFNARNEIMASMSDIYQAGKSNNQALLDSLRKDFRESVIVTSTLVKYGGHRQEATIIHNYGSKLIQSVRSNIVIPTYISALLTDVLNTNEGLRYLQALFNTNDNASQIKGTLQKLSDCPIDKINCWSAPLSDRPTERFAGFSKNYDQFYIEGYYGSLSYGRSRTVRINHAFKNGGAP